MNRGKEPPGVLGGAGVWGGAGEGDGRGEPLKRLSRALLPNVKSSEYLVTVACKTSFASRTRSANYNRSQYEYTYHAAVKLGLFTRCKQSDLLYSIISRALYLVQP